METEHSLVNYFTEMLRKKVKMKGGALLFTTQNGI